MNGDDDVFADALSLPAAERAAFLVNACKDDVTQRARVEALLRGYERAQRILNAPLAPRGALVPDDMPIDRIGRYKLLQKIGEGGCGVVWMAEQEEPVRRRVALKVIKLGMDTKLVIARFEAERQALAMMDHPNIARVLDGGATNTGRPYFVMELVRGVRITEYCDDAQLATRDRLELFIKVCQAIQHAHQKGIIHRDIKPSNILVTVNDSVAVPKVIDFGIAKATEERLTDKTIVTQFEALIGTPAYMSPEQMLMTSVDIDTRCDIYSLGVLLYEMLTGTTPFDTRKLLASGLDEMRKTIREKEPVPPSTRLATLQGGELTTTAKRRSVDTSKLRHQLQGDLDWIVMKCLEKDRARRYETANGLASDIQRHLNNEAVLARPPSAAYRFQKTVKRNKLAFVAASAVTLTLIAGLSFSTWAFLREAMQRRIAVDHQSRAVRAQEAEKQERLRADAQKVTAQRHLYVANMNLAQQAWQQNNINRLRQLLEETRDSPDRGFEWYYWQRQTHLSLKTLRGHSGLVTSVAFSPDGRRIATGSFDHTAKIWEVATGREVLTLEGHLSEVRSVAFSPDGRRLVTGGHDQTARVWDTSNGRQLFTLSGHGAQIYSVVFSPRGEWIATAGGDNIAKVWDAANGRELVTFDGHASLIFSVAFSPDGRRIITGSDDQTAKVWDAASGRPLLTLRGHRHAIFSAAFSPDGRRIVTGSHDQTVKLWDAASGQELLTLEGHTDMVRGASFSPDGHRIVSCSHDQTAKIWDADTGRPLLTLKGHAHRVVAVAFSPDGKRIVTGSRDQSAKLWDTADNREVRTLEGHQAAIHSAAISPDSRQIVTGSWDHTAKLWDAANGRELRELKGHVLGILSVAFSSDGRRIVTGSWDQTARVWDAANGQLLLTLEGHRTSIWAVACSPNGDRIATGGYDRTAKIWNAASGRELLTLTGHSARIWSLAFSPDGRRVVTGSDDRLAKVWDAITGRELLTLKGHGGLIKSVAISPDGERIATGSADHTAKVWDSATGQELLTLEGHAHQVRSVAFSPDGQRIVTGSADQTARLWDATNGRELLTLSGHTAAICSAVISRDGKFIASGSDDRTCKVWPTAGLEEVAAWGLEEQAAAQNLAARRRERTAKLEPERLAYSRDPGAIKEWLVLAPIQFSTGPRGANAVDTDLIGGEALSRPRAGDGTIVGGVDLKWQETAQESHVIDFNVILGDQTQLSVAYAVCYIRSDVEQRGLHLLIGSDDEAKLYLNGKQIYTYAAGRGFVADQDAVTDVTLNAGSNVVVFKVVNEFADWKGSLRFTDAQGNPLKGIHVTLSP